MPRLPRLLPTTDGVRVAAPGRRTHVAVDAAETPAVHLAVDDLLADVARVADVATTRTAAVAGAQVVVGTLGTSALVDDAADLLDLDPLRTADGAPRWEAYTLQVADGRLWVVGADRRGTVYGVYALCEAMGVSPWHWWADVPVRRRPHVTVPHDLHVADHPSVRYRGIFLNDEEQLEAWARRHTDDGTIGPATYARVCELLLRLGGNYLWPAMHVNAFNADPENGRLAHERGVVVGTSHCDMLLRSNQHEWEPWAAAHGGDLVYDWSVPGRNREMLREYWRGSVRQNAGYEVTWTLGMRGIHDSGFETAHVDADTRLSEPEKHRARLRLLQDVVAAQRDVLAEVLGPERATDAPQVFVPYKEVLPLYDDGLDLPDDVTLLWSDDSFGHVRRFPTPAERDRRGGHGLYFHHSYWSPPPRSYLFLSSMPLPHVRRELRRSWDAGIREVWVDNVGALKPLEQDVEHFLRYAWDVGHEAAGEDRPTADPRAWTAAWVDRDVSGGHGERVAALLEEWAQVTDVRKVEHLSSRAFDQTAWGDEAARRVAALHRLAAQVADVHAALPPDERDAFVQLVAFKVWASALVAAQFAHADRSLLAHDQGRWRAADHHLALSRAFDAHKRALLHFYDRVMAGGRWRDLVTPERFPPPTTAMFPAARPALRVGAPELVVVAWGDPGPVDAPRLTFSPHGPAVRWLDVGNAGSGTLDVEVTVDAGWVRTDWTGGPLDVERRVAVRVDDATAHTGRSATVTVRTPHDGRRVDVVVEVLDVPAPPAGWDGWLEADGALSLPAAQADERHDGATTRWQDVPGLGRGGGALVEVRRTGGPHGATTTAPADTPADGVADPAALVFHVHLVTPGAHEVELHRLPTLDSTGRVRVAVQADDRPPVVLESPTTDEHRGTWETAVVEHVERLRTTLPWLDAGPHVLRVLAVDPGVGLHRVVVHTVPAVGARGRTALGPPTSARTDRPASAAPDPDPLATAEAELARLDAFARDVLRTDPADVPLHPVVYVGRQMWAGPTTFTPNETVEQDALGPSRYAAAPDGGHDRLAALPSGPVVERDGMLAVDVARALRGTADAWTTPSLDAPRTGWVHTQAETAGGTGLALHVDAPKREWTDPHEAPGVHVRVRTDGGRFAVWALVKYDHDRDDACWLALDGTPQPASEQLSGGDLFTFGTTQVWVWALLADLDVPPGDHVLSVLARRAGLRVDRLWLTRDERRPPPDATWPA
ncbi:glycosyl hydrolase 115 family protein [Cellulomonas sp. SLBN-39]|uniref:glycosyl hydrolase 115 family protein n=1 Tax=Cellulomonas sp. SLBN-39 TaxID=2768446 RepID=UPI001152594A|nr:glycosyl hydrolase 115 family protein [Cellulomonas sp. SLBN-39]TQL02902.1 glycosyl hydrolase family 115 (putative glucuronidase) [Cellulomonas sp. SLBN-39]